VQNQALMHLLRKMRGRRQARARAGRIAVLEFPQPQASWHARSAPLWNVPAAREGCVDSSRVSVDARH